MKAQTPLEKIDKLIITGQRYLSQSKQCPTSSQTLFLSLAQSCLTEAAHKIEFLIKKK